MTDTANPSVSPESAAAPPASSFISDAGRSKRIPLKWPKRLNGKDYEAITVCRMTGNDLRIWSALYNEDRSIPVGLFLDDEGNRVPVQILETLDADDEDAVFGANNDFLPQRLRAALDSEPVTSTSSAPGSPESSTPQ